MQAHHASDGGIGTVKDIYFDDRRWVLRYIIVDIGSWLVDRKVLISPISVREAVKTSPECDESHPLSREQGESLYAHHEQQDYRP